VCLIRRHGIHALCCRVDVPSPLLRRNSKNIDILSPLASFKALVAVNVRRLVRRTSCRSQLVVIWPGEYRLPLPHARSGRWRALSGRQRRWPRPSGSMSSRSTVVHGRRRWRQPLIPSMLPSARSHSRAWGACGLLSCAVMMVHSGARDVFVLQRFAPRLRFRRIGW